jgi:hypothetical protein
MRTLTPDNGGPIATPQAAPAQASMKVSNLGGRKSNSSPVIDCWWAHQDLNLEPTDYESAALTN